MKRLIIFSLVLFFLGACDKDPVPVLAPTITTGLASNVGNTTAIVNLSITNISNSKEIGVLYSSSSAILIPSNARKKSIIDFKTGNNSVFLTGISAGTLYYYKAYTTDGVDYIYGDVKTFTTGGVQDIDGNVYNTVTIGTQTWMAENLKTTKYRNGQSIPNIKDANSWISLTTGAWCDYENNASNGTYFGKLYNWHAVSDARNIAPVGWHVPTTEEWTVLENYLITSGYNYDGTTTGNKIAKSLAAKTDWGISTDIGVIGNDLTKNNKSGFSALPGGYRSWKDGIFYNLNYYGKWWSSTRYNNLNAWDENLYFDGSGASYAAWGNQAGFSVRCIKDY